MSRCNIYFDESGDLGFAFHAPYRRGGSSRYLTLSAVICEENSSKYIKRFIADFCRTRSVPSGKEIKWVDLDLVDRVDFAQLASKLAKTHRKIRFSSITVYKPNVMPHIRADANKLYNYMVGLFLLPVMKRFDEVCFVPDARSIKVQSGNSLHDYLQTKLWFEESVNTKLITNAMASTQCRPLHFADYLCGTFQTHYEDGIKEPRNALNNCTPSRELFFPQQL